MRSASPALRPRQVLRRATVLAVPVLRLRALPLPAAGCLTISATGLITGTARTRGTSTVTVSGAPVPGAAAATTLAWTFSPPPVRSRGIPAPPKGQP